MKRKLTVLLAILLATLTLFSACGSKIDYIADGYSEPYRSLYIYKIANIEFQKDTARELDNVSAGYINWSGLGSTVLEKKTLYIVTTQKKSSFLINPKDNKYHFEIAIRDDETGNMIAITGSGTVYLEKAYNVQMKDKNDTYFITVYSHKQVLGSVGYYASLKDAKENIKKQSIEFEKKEKKITIFYE